MVNFPTPVGGTILHSDFAPSLLFAILYGLLLPLIVYRCIDKKSRNWVFSNTVTYAIERTIIFSLRAVWAQRQASNPDTDALAYIQVTLALGYINVSQDIAKLLRTMLVNATYPTPPSQFANKALVTDSSQSTEIYQLDYMQNASPVSLPDDPKRRARIRCLTGRIYPFSLCALVPATVSGSLFSQAMQSKSTAHATMGLRYTAVVVSGGILSYIYYQAWVALRYNPRVDRRAASILVILCTLMMSSPIYRLTVMCNTTDNLLSTGSGSLNSPLAKACFYLFHIVPEYLVTCIIFGINMRQVFNTGANGDTRTRDETPEERQKRLGKEAEKNAKKARNAQRGNPLVANAL